MHRSFTDRVLGGVCAGLAANLHLNAWVLRFVFILLVFMTTGVGALLYAALWWMLPQESLIQSQRSSSLRTVGVLLVTVLLLGAWLAQQTGWLNGPSGQNILTPVVLLIVSVVFFMRQVRGA